MIDYIFNTPTDSLPSRDCVARRCDLIKKNARDYRQSIVDERVG
ncbi:MAG TPA: hypothetical protein VFD57_02595 [Clostridia bacterium]|nr:hypothetical protein [Clostridia bacterium]